MILPTFKYANRKDKAVMFFSASSVSDTKLLLEAGLYDILISYHYLRKSPDFYINEVLPEVKKHGGLFMIDSGAFSFQRGRKEMTNPKDWEPYLEEYVGWIDTHCDSLFSAANLDLDSILGREVIDKWNKKYFKPLEKKVQVNYVAHAHREYNDPTGMKRLTEYCKLHEYVGVSSYMTGYAATIASIIKRYRRRIHGYAWTSIPLLKSFPFFSCDSTTWLGGMRYGTTYYYDGKNFKVLDHKKKFMRKGKKLECVDKGIDYDLLMKEKRVPVNLLNLEGWKGARYEYLKFANMKLTNKPIQEYGRINHP